MRNILMNQALKRISRPKKLTGNSKLFLQFSFSTDIVDSKFTPLFPSEISETPEERESRKESEGYQSRQILSKNDFYQVILDNLDRFKVRFHSKQKYSKAGNLTLYYSVSLVKASDSDDHDELVLEFLTFLQRKSWKIRAYDNGQRGFSINIEDLSNKSAPKKLTIGKEEVIITE